MNQQSEIVNKKFFYGWVIVAIATLSLAVSNGLSIGGIPVFYKSVQNDLVNSGAVTADRIQTVYGIAPALTFLLAGLIAPFAGFLIQYLKARTMMVIGCFILGGGLALYSQAQTALIVYISHSLLGLSLGFVGVLVSTVLISNWFSKKRGTALGIVLTGTSIGGFMIPIISTPLILDFGWRKAIIIVSLIIWLILLPAVIFLVKNQPSDIGQNVDGDSGSSLTFSNNDEYQTSGLTLLEAIKTPIFWLFSLCAALIFYAIFVVSQQLNLYAQSPKIGLTPPQASFIQSLLFSLSVAGKFAFGWLSDRFSAVKVMLFSAATMFLSTLTFLDFNNNTVYLFAILFGLNYGGTFVILQLLVADYFGLKEYGKILGAVTVIETIGGAAGTIITGRLADLYGGDYTQSFYLLIVVSGLALLIVIALNYIYSKGKKFQQSNTYP
jgi:MFS family permease